MNGVRAGLGAALAEAAATGKSLLSRSKVFAAMAILTGGANLGLPWLLDAGAGAGERMRLLATYSFGATGFLLTVFALWAGSAAISGEASAGTLGLTLAKPAGRWCVWAGKWLAVAAASWALLGVGGAAAAVGMWRLSRGEVGGDPWGGAWETRRAEVPEAEAETEARLAQWGRTDEAAAAGLASGGAAAAAWRAAARKSVLRERYTVGAGEEAAWKFSLPGDAGDAVVAARWRAHATEPGVFRLQGVLEAEGAGGAARVRMDGASGVPQEAVLEGWRAEEGEAWVRVRVESGGEGNPGWGFDPAEGVVLRIRRGGTWANFWKGVLLLGARLALLAAVGTAFGTWFSGGTAGFLSAALVVTLSCSGVLEEAAGVDRATFVRSLRESTSRTVERVGADGETVEEERSMPVWAATAMWGVYRGTAAVLRPLTGDRSAGDACEGEWIPWRRVGRGVLVCGVVGPAVLCAFCSWGLRRREWGAVT